jgi:hypothetical protein
MKNLKKYDSFINESEAEIETTKIKDLKKDPLMDLFKKLKKASDEESELNENIKSEES